MAKFFTCSCCRSRLLANPRIKNQQYCSKVGCQRERKRKWQLSKMVSDPDYRANQQDAYRAWRERNPGYWQQRRLSPPPESASPTADTVKMDAIESFSRFVPGTYLITPLRRATCKMDAIKVKIVPFSSA